VDSAETREYIARITCTYEKWQRYLFIPTLFIALFYVRSIEGGIFIFSPLVLLILSQDIRIWVAIKNLPKASTATTPSQIMVLISKGYKIRKLISIYVVISLLLCLSVLNYYYFDPGNEDHVKGIIVFGLIDLYIFYLIYVKFKNTQP